MTGDVMRTNKQEKVISFSPYFCFPHQVCKFIDHSVRGCLLFLVLELGEESAAVLTVFRGEDSEGPK